MRTRIALLSLALSCCCAPATAAPPMDVETGASGNTYISGPDPTVIIPVAADLTVVGGRVRVEREVGADALVAGGAVDVRGPVAQDLRVAGGSVDLFGKVGGELAAAAASLRLEGPSSVEGDAWLAGANVLLAGTLNKDVKVVAHTLALSGEIKGNARLFARELHILPGAKIGGNLVYASRTALSAEERARVSGTVTREIETPGFGKPAPPPSFWRWFHPFFVLSMLTSGALLFFSAPAHADRVQRSVRGAPVKRLLSGLAWLFVVPPVALICMITVLGMPFGLAMLALYPVMLLLGYLATALALARRAGDALKLPAPGRLQLLVLLGGALLVLRAAASIPYIGTPVAVATLAIGIGALSAAFQEGGAAPPP